MRALGAIVVGIGSYRYDSIHFPVLKYAANDADGIAQYLATCWPEPDEAKVLRIPEQTATESAVRNAFRTLASVSPCDVLWVFLSGHGLVEGENAGFVLQPASDSADVSLLDHAMLNALLASVPAKRTILVLDCCYAEGITRRMTFFSALEDSDARLFIASSRERQLTWEDEHVGHGIFTAHLLDLLRTGNSVKLKSVRDQLDVDGELFPILCDQVPLYVYEHKQQRQEPVKGGVASRAVTLPVARSARRIKQRTAFGTAVRRVQIMGGAVMVAAAFLFFAYALAYFAEADRNGDVYLRHGTKWLAPAYRLIPNVRADTGISFSDLSDDPATRYSVQAGETSGFWTQLARQGYRAWYDNLRPSLDPAAAVRYDVLLDTGAIRPVYRLTDESRPSEIAFAAWALLDRSDARQLDALFRDVLGADRTSPLLTRFAANNLDFNVLDRPQSQLGSYASALRAAAAVDPDRTFTAFVGFLKANEIWLAHASPEQHGEEAQRRAAEDVADVLATIGKARADRGQSALDPNMLSVMNGLAELGYGRLVNLSLSRVGYAPAERIAEASRALAAFHGDVSEPAQAAAIRQLKDLLDSSPASQAIVQQTYDRFVKFGGPEQSDLTGFLIVAAGRKALPRSIIALLLEKAQQAVDRPAGEFIDTEYARILAHAVEQVPEASRPLVYKLIGMVAADVTPMASSTAEIYTALGRRGLETPAMFDWILKQASAAAPYKKPDANLVAEPLPGLSIVVSHGPWLTALAVLGSIRALPPAAIHVLESHSDDPSVHEMIVRALANQPGVWDQPCWRISCCQMLSGFPADATRRQLASEVLAERLAKVPRREFVNALEKLRNERTLETEPEVRIALTLATINAQLARVRTSAIGDQLFE